MVKLSIISGTTLLGYYICLGTLLYMISGMSSPWVVLLAVPTVYLVVKKYSAGAYIYLGALQLIGVMLLTIYSKYGVVAMDKSSSGIVLITILLATTAAAALHRPKEVGTTQSVNLPEKYASEQFTMLLDSVSESFLGLDTNGNIVFSNLAARNLLGHNDLQNKNIGKIVSVVNETDTVVDLNVLLASRSKEIINRADLKLKNADEAPDVALDLTITPVEKNDLSIVSSLAYIMVIRDITERKNLDIQREEFVSVISHELRTPISIAEGDLGMLLNPKIVRLDEQSLHYAAVAHDQVRFLSQIINQITSITNLDKGTFKTNPEPLHAAELTQSLRDEYKDLVAEKGLMFRCIVGENLPVVITTPSEVKEILVNLLGNAIKYTSQGTITLSVEGSYRGDPGILYSVQDTGIGMTKDDADHVFDKFWRSEDYKTRESGGTGLGLYICERLADRLHAKLWVESEVGRGSKFSLFISRQVDKPQDVKSLLVS